MLKHHIKPVLGILVLSISCGYAADKLTSDKVANFYLSPGFRRRVDIVKTRQNNLESPGDWNCKTDSNNPNSTNLDNLYIDKTAVHTLTLQENLSFQITVESTLKIDDPVIIIKFLKKNTKNTLECQDERNDETETLHAEEEHIFGQGPIPKGTYHIFLGSYINPIHEYNHIHEYKIIISECDPYPSGLPNKFCQVIN